MDLRTLQYFVTIVEEKTITAAAEKLHMTQPPLTMQLHALERELGCSLFRREGRGLKLTDAGRQMYRRATEILNMCANAKQEMTEYRLGARRFTHRRYFLRAGHRFFRMDGRLPQPISEYSNFRCERQHLPAFGAVDQS